MSRIGKRVIVIPEGVTIKVKGRKILVDGPKGSLSRLLPQGVFCAWFDPNFTYPFTCEVISVTAPKSNDNDTGLFAIISPVQDVLKPFFGLTRTLVADMIKGVEEGFTKRLQLEGVGYRARVEGDYLILNVGYSKPVELRIPKQVSVNVENSTKICVFGLQKDRVGSFASKICSIRPPEPYKGKGIILEGTVIRRKAGKTGK